MKSRLVVAMPRVSYIANAMSDDYRIPLEYAGLSPRKI